MDFLFNGCLSYRIAGMEKIFKLIKDRRFWLLVCLNLLSAILVWMVHHWNLSETGKWVFTLIALVNAVIGTYLTWRLFK